MLALSISIFGVARPGKALAEPLSHRGSAATITDRISNSAEMERLHDVLGLSFGILKSGETSLASARKSSSVASSPIFR